MLDTSPLYIEERNDIDSDQSNGCRFCSCTIEVPYRGEPSRKAFLKISCGGHLQPMLQKEKKGMESWIMKHPNR
jgi:hypothetical protein